MDQPDIIEFRVIRNVPEIINVTFDFIRQNFRLFWRALFFIAFPPIVLGTLIFYYFYLAIFDAAGKSGEVGDLLANFFYVSVLGGLLGATGLTMLIAVVHTFVELYRERGPAGFEVRDVWAEVKKIFWRVLGTLVGLGMVGSLLMLLSIFIPFGSIGLVAIMAFGSLYFPLRLYDKRGFFQSFVVSSKLIERRWWATYGMLCLFALLTLALSGLFLLPILLMVGIGEITGFDWEELSRSTSLLRIVGTVLASLWNTASSLIWVVPLLSLIFHYFSQKERKESIRLLQDVERIGVAEEGV